MELSKPFFVAEVSGNHNGELSRALQIVRECAEAGVSAIKLQTYTAETITLDVDSPQFRISSNHDLWGSKRLYDLYKEAHTPWEWHSPIFDLAKTLGIQCFSTPFDETAVDFLEELGCPIYKIASMEIVDIPLIVKVAETLKPMIISTGTASIGEVSDAVLAARDGGAKDITLMVCTSSYPAKASEANLARLDLLKKLFNVKVGLSDHSLGNAVSISAVALGAEVIEKHVTLSRSDGGVDSAFSTETGELRKLLFDLSEAKQAVGVPSNWRTESESESMRLRPSLYFSEDVQPGELVTNSNVRSVRPSGGLPPVEIRNLLGRRISKLAKKGTPTGWEYFN